MAHTRMFFFLVALAVFCLAVSSAWAQGNRSGSEEPLAGEKVGLLPEYLVLRDDVSARFLSPEADFLRQSTPERPSRLSLSMRINDQVDPLTGQSLSSSNPDAVSRDLGRLRLQGVVDNLGAEVGVRLKLLDF